MRLIWRLVKWAIGAYAVMTLAMLAWTFLWPEPDLQSMEQADVIVCMGGGMDPRGTLAQPTLTRIERCVDLFDAGVAPVIIFTGGLNDPNLPSAGFQMMTYAQSLGLPETAGIEEGRAQSTLQNALFSLEYAIGAQDFVIVTEAFHLPRSWLSFHWARWQSGAPNSKTFRLVMSENVRRDPVTNAPNWTMLFRESVAIWFNIARAAAYSIAPDPSLDWLH